MIALYISVLDTDSDKEKFRQIYERYRGLMFYIANNFIGNEADAEDAVHDAFLKIIKHLNGIDQITSHKTKSFIVIVIESVSKDFLKKQRRNKIIDIDEKIYDVPSDENFVDTLLEKTEIEIIFQALGKLQDIHRDILVLRYINEYSDKEIAKILDISDSAVRKRLERARNALYHILENGGELNEQK